MSSAAPPPPAVAATIAGDALPRLVALADLLAGPGIERGLLGPREVPRLWERHLLNCAVLIDLLPTRARAADVGSGAGLPGLVLAVLRPDLELVLVEPLLRRTRFLEEAVAALGLERVEVRRARAEELAGAGLDVVTARAVAPLDRLAGWCLPMLGEGGELLALKGASAAEELDAAVPALRAAHASAWSVVRLGSGVLAEPTWVVRVSAGRGSSRRPVGPRRPGRRRTRRT